MEQKEKIIIAALVVFIIALLVGIFVAMPNFTKHDTDLTFESKSTIDEGDSIKIKLTDVNGTAIAGQTINITITNKDNSKDYHSVVTDDKGVGKLKLDKKAGKYSVDITYNGNDKYKGCNLTKNIKIEEKVVEAQTSSSSSSSSTPSAYAYKSDGTPMYSQQEVDNYMLNKYGMVNYHVGSNGYIDMDEPGYDNAGNPLW